ncbi:MAG: phosphotransferase [Myxococcota bacterium]
MSTQPPSVANSVSYQEALERCVAHWDLVPERTRLVRDGGNHVFASEETDGRPVIVRVSDGTAHTRNEIEGELIWLDHLRSNGCTVSTPIRSRNGELVETSELDSGTFHASCFIRFGGKQVDPKSDPEWDTPLLEALGREIGRVHRVSDTLALPRDHDRKPWYQGIGFRVPTRTSPGLDPKVCDAMGSFLDDVRRRPTKPRHYGLIHADLHAGNFLYEDGVIELIDFDLGSYGWRVMDFVSLLFIHYYFPSRRIPDASPEQARNALAAMVRGYRRTYTLDREQLESLNDLIKLRSILNYLVMAPSPEHWQIALGDPTPSVRESTEWIERHWVDGQSFDIDVRGI